MLGWSTQLGNKLFGPDPKLEFAKPGQGLDLLAGRTIPLDSPYWRQYLTLFDSPSDVVLLLPSTSLLSALHSNPLNVLTLLYSLTTSLFSLLSNPSFPNVDLAKEALNAVRVLSRVVPIVLAPRVAGAVDEVEEELFWRREEVPVKKEVGEESASGKEKTKASEAEGQFVLEDEDDEDATPADPLTSASASTAPPAAEDPAYEELPPLAERLLGALVDLLFVPGFTLPESSRAGTDSSIVTYSIWEPGIASPAPSHPRPPLPLSTLSARLEILRLLTLLISLPSLLTSPSHFPSLPNTWREALVSGRAAGRGDKNVVLCLLCSVLNTALNAGAAGATGGEAGSAGAGLEGLRERAARLAAETAKRTTAPVATGSADGSDESSVKNALVGACLQFLDAVLIDHAPIDGPESAPNQFAFYLSKLHRPSDFSFLQSGLVGLITTSLAAPATSSLFPLGLPLPVNIPSSSPGSPARTKKPAGWTTEALTIFWRTLDTNRKFVSWLVKPDSSSEGKSRLLETLVAVEACMLDWHTDETQIGLVRLASFVMQTLSAEVASAGLAGKDAEEEVKRLLNAPLEPEVVGARLAGVVRRQVASQGIDVGEERQGDRDGKRETRSVTLVEYLLIVLHALLIPSSTTTAAPQPTRSSLSTLYPSLLLTVSNLSPFFRDVGAAAATRLVRVWLAFSAPSWVLMEEGNPRLIFYLLETFNNVVHFNLDSNPHVMYALTVTYQRFDLLANFTLAQGIAEARRLRAARRERQQRAASSGPTLRPINEGVAASARRSEDSPGASSEKALGKRRERPISLGSLADLSLSSPSSPNLSRTTSNTSGGPLSPTASEAGETGDGQRPFVGKNGFVPTTEWVAAWREGLPLDTLMIVLSELRPKLLELDPSFPTSTPSASVIASLRTLLVSPSLITLLPPLSSQPSPRVRSFVSSAASMTWLASVIYGRIYLSQLDYLRDTLAVQLFAIAQAPNSAAGGLWRRAGAVGGVQGVVGGLSAGLGAELDRVSRSAVEVGGKVGDTVRGVLGRFGGNSR
ncbi:High-temperature-induced dauer-formation protein-domain containing protein [Rhodotorula toruloides]|uniref:High-temperature-induced dauer-formation protein-domain containing protein n=1 Tax=Rhodotorula toruloides TaxID=5286 RepID=A0A0K3CA81_RHOTO|nr:High-temperature-induced dauer-formation protein-domain containing protein [Rhodotorula toruloides]PRQ74819.1 High-temperature-induced dauer-formation protein-domain containing protein [Rhodotorula toruloides]